MSPFIVNDETQNMVVNNICYLLNSFISCSEYDNVIFCWVMHEMDTEKIDVTCVTIDIKRRF